MEAHDDLFFSLLLHHSVRHYLSDQMMDHSVKRSVQNRLYRILFSVP
jgi:hypothetical protein